jgi:hypothetical protein
MLYNASLAPAHPESFGLLLIRIKKKLRALPLA